MPLRCFNKPFNTYLLSTFNCLVLISLWVTRKLLKPSLKLLILLQKLQFLLAVYCVLKKNAFYSTYRTSETLFVVILKICAQERKRLKKMYHALLLWVWVPILVCYNLFGMFLFIGVWQYARILIVFSYNFGMHTYLDVCARVCFVAPNKELRNKNFTLYNRRLTF